VRRILARSIFTTACVVACASTLSNSAAADDRMPERLRNRLIKRVAQTTVNFPETRGFALRVDMPGVGAFSYAEGSAHPFGEGELATSNIYRMASVTKTFSAVAILKLVDQGLVSLDDPVVKYVPACPNGSEITVRDLLGMTSGLADYSSRPEFFTGLLLDPSGFAEREVVADICSLEPVMAPGLERVYNNSGYYLLGPIIEDATGEPWQSWMTTNVIEPARLTRTSIPTDAVLPKEAVAGWFYFEAPPKVQLGPWWDLTALHPAYAGTAGCGYSTLEDLASWAGTLLSGALLSPATRAAQFDLQPIDDEEYESYGLGIAQFGPWIGHTGVTLGSYAWMLKHQPTGTTIVAFVECGSETPHIDLEGMARDLSAWPKLPAE
jgi:D-alanyl-D-alanine carboxypeptidase